MLKVVVLVSGGGTNLAAVLEAVENGTVTNARVEAVISNNPNAYALERAAKRGIAHECISPRAFEGREQFNQALLFKLNELDTNKVPILCHGSNLGGSFFPLLLLLFILFHRIPSMKEKPHYP